MASFLNKVWSGLDVWDKKENEQQRKQFAAPRPQPARAPQQRNTFTDNSVTRGASRSFDQLNPFDGGRTWKQRTPTMPKLSTVHQLTHNGATNMLGDSVVKPTIRMGLAVNQGIGNLELKLAGRKTQNAEDYFNMPGTRMLQQKTGYTGTKRQIAGDTITTAANVAMPGSSKALNAGISKTSAKVVPKVIQKATPQVVKTVAPKVVGNAVVGGTGGAVSNVGSLVSSNDPLNRQTIIKSAKDGAITGTIVNGALPIAAPFVKAGGKATVRGAKIIDAQANGAPKRQAQNMVANRNMKQADAIRLQAREDIRVANANKLRQDHPLRRNAEAKLKEADAVQMSVMPVKLTRTQKIFDPLFTKQPGLTIGGPLAREYQKMKDAGLVFDGVDGKPRFEVDDSGARLNDKEFSWGLKLDGKPRKVGDILEHDKLFEQYPELKNVNVRYEPNDLPGHDAHFDPTTNSIVLTKSRADKSALSDIIHELQHSIQEKEGFAGGGAPEYRNYKAENASIKRGLQDVNTTLSGKNLTPEQTQRLRAKRDNLIKQLEQTQDQYGNVFTKAKDIADYRKLAGEAEARAVQARMNMPMSERYSTPNEYSFKVSTPKNMPTTQSGMMSFSTIAKNLKEAKLKAEKFASKNNTVLYPETLKESSRPVETIKNSTFYNSLDVPKQDLIIKNGEGKAMSIDPDADYIKKIRQPIEKELQEAQAEMDKYGTGYINDIDRAAAQAKAKARLDRAKDADWQNSESKIRARKESDDKAFRAANQRLKESADQIAEWDKAEPWYKAREEIKNSYISKFNNADDFVADFNTNEGVIPKEIKHAALGDKQYTSKEEMVKTLTDIYNQANSGKAMSIDPLKSLKQEAKPPANAFQDTLPSKTRPDSIRELVKRGGNPLYHDTNANGVLGILDSGEIRANQAPFSSIAGQGKRVSTTRNFDNYSRYGKSPYRFVIDETKTGQKAIPDNREEFESIFKNNVKTDSVDSLTIDVTNPELINDMNNGRLAEVIAKAKEKGIRVETFEGKILPDEYANKEIQQMTKDKFTKEFGQATQSQPPKSPLAKDPLESLKQEARKYKSAEEFVKAQGEPAYHRSQNKFDKFDISKVSNASNRQNGGWGLYFSDAEPSNQAYGNYLYEVRVPKDTLLESGSPVSESVVSKIVDAVKRDNRNPNELNEFSHNGWLFYKTLGRILGSDKKASLFLARNGVDGLKMNRGSNFNDYILFDDKSIKTKQQLTDIYNQAHTQPQAPVAQAKVEAPVDADEAFRQELRAQGMTVPDDYVQYKPTVTTDNLDTNRLKTDPQYQREVYESMFAVGQPTKEGLMKQYKKVFGNYAQPQAPVAQPKVAAPQPTVAPVQKPLTKAAIPATKTVSKVDRSITKDGNVVGSDPLIQEYADFLRDIGEKNGVDILENGTRVSNNVRSRHLAGVQMSKGDWYDEAVRQIKTGEADQDFLDYYKSAKVAALDSNKKLRLTQDPMQKVFSQNPVNEEATLLQNNRANKQIGMNNAINDNFAKNGAELPDAKVHTEKWYDKMWRDTQSIIERQGKAGKELSGMLDTARDNRELWLADIERRIPTVLKLKGKDFSDFVEATQGNMPIAKGSKIEKAVNEWRAVHPEIRQRGVNAGLEIGDLGSTYYPHFVDYDRIFKDKNTYNQAINHLVSTNQAPNAEAAMQLLSQARDVSRNRRFGNLESSRLIDLPFYDKTNNSLRSYLASSAKRIADAEVFGPKDENALKLITEAGRNGFDTEAMKNAYDVAVGARRYGATASKISRGVRQYNTTTKLGLGAMTNIAQNVNTGVVTGHMNTLKNMAKMATPESRKFAHETGVIADAVINDLREQQGYSFAANVLGKGVKAITAPMFGTVEKFNRAVAANAGRDYAIKLAKKGDVKTLRRLGVTGDISRNLTLDQQIQAARKIVEKTQFKVDPQDLPGWVDSPGGKLVAQFRSFSYNQGKFFSNEILKPIHKDKNMMPLIRLMAAMPLGYGLYEMRRIIAGQPEEENPTKVALQSFSKIGGAGLATDIYQGINPVGSKYLPSDRRQSMAASSLGGPTVGTAMQGIGALSDLAQRKNTPKDLGRLDGKIAVAKTSDSYTDATPAARFALQQVPIVGTPIKNRVLPFKKESQADTGKLPLEGTASAATATTSDPKELLTAAFSTKQGREMMSLSEEKKKEWAKQSSDNQALYNQYKTMKQRFSPGVKDKDQYSPTELEFKQREAGFQEKGRNTWYKRLDSKYSGLYNSANEVTKAMGVADLPKTNQTVSDFISFNKQYQGAKNDLERGDLQKEFVKKAYRNSLTDTQKYLFGNTYNDSQILAAVDKGIISLDDIKTAVGLDNYMKAKGLSSSLDVSKKVRALIGAASGGSGGSRGRGRTAKGSRRKSKVTSIVMPTYSTANRKMQSLLKSTRA